MRHIAIQSMPSCTLDATRLAARLNVPISEISVHRFPDGELRVTVAPAATTTIVYAPLDHPSEQLLATLFAGHTLRAIGVKRIVLVAPYLCYMRQDTAFHPGEAIGQMIVGKLLAGVVDRVVTVDAHLHRTPALGNVFPGIEADNLSAMPAIADAIRKDALDPRTVIVGPDAESRQWVIDLAGRLNLSYAVATKTRHADRSVDVVLKHPTSVAGRPILLVDDIVSSGGTLKACARALFSAGAASVDAIVTHALFAPAVMSDLSRAGIRSIRSTTSVPHSTNAIALDDVLAEALRKEVGAAAHSERVS